MAKNSITDYDNIAGNNTDIQSVDIAEGCAPSGINNAIREVMADLADVNDGTVTLTSPSAASMTVAGDLTVDTNTLVVDSTNNRVGIGTSSPNASAKLDVRGSILNGNSGQAETVIGVADAASNYYSVGNRGNLVVQASSSTTGAQAQSGGRLFLRGGDSYNGNQGDVYIYAGRNLINNAKSQILFEQGLDESMRLDQNGNLLVGKSVTTFSTDGTVIYSPNDANGSRVNITNDGETLNLNRKTSDGDIVIFYKNGSTVGSIGTISGVSYIQGTSTGSGLSFGSLTVYPMKSGAFSDNQIDLGSASYRFDDVYATNGTIQTSDRNEKENIASMSDAEITAAKAISKLFKTFKWKDAVAEKGDSARTHAGVIAQDVQQAMTDAGLDAGNYAFFISSTWWETQTEVPAVEAVEAVDAVYEDVVIPAVEEQLDEEGNVIVEAQPERVEQRLVSEAVEAVEGKEAYTRTDIYDTAEEAPEGATERTRLGIRYPELLAFIGAATEQRLASIEARLDALEA